MATTISKLAYVLSMNTAPMAAGAGQAEKILGNLSGSASAANMRISSGMAGLQASVASAAAGFTALAAAAAVAGAAAGAAFAGWGIKLAAQSEVAKVGFEVMLGSADKATKVIADLKAFAASTPFEFGELQVAARSLVAFGVSADDLIPTLRSVGDVASGISAPIGEIAEIYGKARVQGRLFMEDINQLTGRGIPIIQELASQFGVAESKVRELVSSGKVGFENLKTAFQSLTGEGGKFGNMMGKQASTLSGEWSTLVDTMKGVAETLGEALLPAAKVVVESLTTTVGSLGVLMKAAAPTIQNIANRMANFFREILVAVDSVIRKTVEWAEYLNSVAEHWGVVNKKSIQSYRTGFVKATKEVDEAAESTNEKMEQIATTVDDLSSRGKELAKSLRTPDEVYADTVSELKRLYDAAAISQETYNRGLDAAADKLKKATGEAKNLRKVMEYQPTPALSRNSVAGFSAALQNEFRAREIVEQAKKAELERKKQHAETNELLKKNTVTIKQINL